MKVSRRINLDRQLNLGELGKFAFDMPAVSVVAGKTPLVVRGIDMGYCADQFVNELWESNRISWGLSDDGSSSLDHLTAPKRLNRHRNKFDRDSAPE